MNKILDRLSFKKYAMVLAYASKLRSPDPWRQVGSVALNYENRVIGTAYNGLMPGFDEPEDFWRDRDARQKYIIHSETNLLSLFSRGEAKIVACTTLPCTSCMQNLCAHNIKEVYYDEDYPLSEAKKIAEMYGIVLEQITDYPKIEL